MALREGGHEEDAEKAIRAGMVAALVNSMDPYAIFDMTWPEVLRLIKGPERPPFPGKWDFNMIGKAAFVSRD